jgi:hypothetical protein
MLGWSTQEIAWRLRLDERRVRRLLGGGREVPDTMAIWIENMVNAILSQPIEPADWHNGRSLLDDPA